MSTRWSRVPVVLLLLIPPLISHGQVTRVVHLDATREGNGAVNNNTTQTDLTHLVVDEASGRLYVAGVNRVFQLTPDLTVERSVVTGPQDDSIYCSARGSCQQGAERVPTDNHNKALLLDSVEKVLIVCGSLFQGVCEKHVLEDISQKWPLVQVPVVANDASSSSVAFIAPGLPDARSHRVLYVAASHTQLGPYRSQEEIPAISSRSLKSHEIIRARRFVQARIKIASQFLETFRIRYVSGFYEDGYAYFFTIQPANADNLDEGYVSKLVRVCANDPSFESYMEVKLSCHSKGTKYNLVQSVDLVQPDQQLAERLKLASNEKIVVAAFAASESRPDLPKSSSALCLYTLPDMKEAFERNAQMCFSANRPNRGLGFIAGANLACPKDPRVVSDFCGEHLMIEGSIPLAAEALIVYGDERLTGILAGTTADSTVVFAATHSGTVRKILVKTRQLALEYGTIQLTKPPQRHSPIRSIQFDSTRRFLFALTKTQVIKVAVAECASHATCGDCIRAQDPFCGWCTLKSRCTQQEECRFLDRAASSASARLTGSPSASSSPPKWLPFSAGQCIDFISILPDRISLTQQRQHPTTVHLRIHGLPALTHGNYSCVFGAGGRAVPAVATADGLACRLPDSAQLAKLEPGRDDAAVPVAVRSSETGLDFISRPLDVFDCAVHARCRTCTASRWNCSWCALDNVCQDATAMCRTSSSVTSNPHACSTISPAANNGKSTTLSANVNDAEILIGHMLPTAVKLAVRGLPISAADGTIQLECLLEAEGRTVRTPALLLNNAGDVMCEEATYAYESDVPELKSATLSLVWNWNHYIDTINVTLYKCTLKGPDCNLCASQPARYQCVWRDERCQVARPEAYKAASDNLSCPAPSVDSIFPVSGPIEGGTVVTIVGRELGMRMEDLTDGAITVAGVPCIPVEYQVSRRVLCRTAAVPSPAGVRSGPVVITLPGRLGHASRQKFYYLNASLHDITPRHGPRSGGIRLTLTGAHLDIGSNVSVAVGGVACPLERERCSSTRLVCLTGSAVDASSDSVPVTVHIDGAMRRLPVDFAFSAAPIITDVEPLTAFLSGGTGIRVYGDNFEAVTAARLVIVWPKSAGESEAAVVNSTECQVQTTRFVLCPAPAVPATLLNKRAAVQDVSATAEGDAVMPATTFVFDVVIEMDGWTSSGGEAGQRRQMAYYPDPVVRPFAEGQHFNQLQGEPLLIEGERLDMGSRDMDTMVVIGEQACTVESLAPDHLTCLPTANMIAETPLPVTLRIGNAAALVGFVQYSLGEVNETAHTGGLMVSSDTVVGIVSGAALLLFCTIVVLILYRRKSSRAEREYRRIQLQMDTLESNVRTECKQAFAELQTDISDMASDLQVSGIPYVDSRTYIVRIFFPLANSHPVLQDNRPCRNNRCHGFESTMSRFRGLLESKAFLLTFIDALEAQSTFGMRDRSNVASLLMTVLLDKLDYFTEVFQHLLVNLMDRSTLISKHPQLMLRRSESVVEKVMSNWVALAMWDYLHGPLGSSLFLLFQAVKHQVEKGPVDYLTHDARYSLAEERLLRQQIDYRCVLIHLHQDESEDSLTKVQCRVINCDSISQVKGKLLDALYKTSPASSRPSVYEIDLEWHNTQHGRIILQDEDATSQCRDGWRRINTLSHYGISESAVMTLVLKSQETAYGPSSARQCQISPYSIGGGLAGAGASRDYTGRIWHLMKPAGSEYGALPAPSHHHPFGTLRNNNAVADDWSAAAAAQQAQRHVPEIFLTRLLSTKGTLQKYIDDLFHLILSPSEPVPLPIKWLFDLYDEYGKRAGSALAAVEADVIHTWKSNSLPLRFWVNLIKNPEFLFDVQKTPTLDACMSVIAQTFMDSCSASAESQLRLGKDSPSSKLLFARDIPQYRGLVKKFYAHIQDASSVDNRQLGEWMANLSKRYAFQLNSGNALKELFSYAVKYRTEITEKLDESPVARQMCLGQEFESLCSAGNFFTLPLVGNPADWSCFQQTN